MPLDLRAADRVRAVADDDLEALLARRLQAVRHRVDVGVDAHADVLEVDDEHVEVAQHLGRRLARLAVQRVDRHAADLVMGVPRLDHVVLHVGPEPVLGPEDSGEPCARVRQQPVGDVAQAGVHRGRVADDPDPAAVEAVRRQQTVASEQQRHFTIIGGPALASDQRALIDYPPLVVSPACFARAESRSSLKSDSLPPCDRCSRAADVQQPPGSGT